MYRALMGPDFPLSCGIPNIPHTPQDRLTLLYRFPILTGLQLLEVLTSCPQISFGGITPGNIPTCERYLE